MQLLYVFRRSIGALLIVINECDVLELVYCFKLIDELFILSQDQKGLAFLNQINFFFYTEMVFHC